MKPNALMRQFNQELQECDELLSNYTSLAGLLDLRETIALLRKFGCVGSANGLQAAAEAVGYTFKEAQ